MINKAHSTANSGDKEQIDSSEQVTELSEDMEMVSPGSMLREARKGLSLSQEHIASKLNFKITLVKNIEEDNFDPAMPVTFIRGYLANYAKLVAVETEDVLASYDALDAASIQRSEMLSFSKETSKQAEHSRVMWISYLIAAVLIGLTILWWLQETSQQEDNIPTISLDSSSNDNSAIEPATLSTEQDTSAAKQDSLGEEAVLAEPTVLTDLVPAAESLTTESSNQAVSIAVNASTDNNEVTEQESQPPAISTAVFTFKGDCWVNIYDATGERIAWGVKKAGYVMTIQGKAPLRITVGKPELTSIVFNEQAVDMSPFNVGNIAKFTLPISVD